MRKKGHKMKLLIVESPTKAKKISSIVGDDFIVKASNGHIADLAKNGQYNLGIDIDNNFKPRYKLMEDKVELLNELSSIANNCDEILLGSDPDREGCAIAMHLYSKLLKCNKPFKRVLFTEITKNGVLKAIENREDFISDKNLNLFHAQESRRMLDRIVGFMASPFLMNFFGSNLSAGRVQSVVSELIIDREKEIEDFKPETYYVIKANLTKDNESSFEAKLDEKITNEKRANTVKDLLSGNKFDSKFTVLSVDADEELKKAPAPMITSQLQKIASKSFGIDPEDTMKAAQSLYENGLCTYIRTDSVRADPDAVKALRDFLKDEGYGLPKTPNAFKTKDTAQDAHECIRPTDLNLRPTDSSLSGTEKKVYEIIWKYFVASQMLPAVYNTLKVSIQHVGSDCVLKASGKALKEQGFLDIMGITDDSKIEIPNLSVGDDLTLHGKKPIICEKKSTQPPPRFTNYSLIEVLEKKNIGRPSTFADVLSKITHRDYVKMDGNTFRPTELGVKTTEALKKSFTFMQYNYTAELEKKLDEIESGNINYTTMMTNFFNSFKEELDKAYVSNGASLCDRCGSPMKNRVSKDGSKFQGCGAYPACSYTTN